MRLAITWQELGRRCRKLGTELLFFAVIIGVTFAARSAVADHYYIPSGSMEYSLLVGDRVLVDKTAYGLRIPFTEIEILEERSPARGEIVVFDSPESGVRLIKRVVGVSGDQLALVDGCITVNGERLESRESPGVELFGERRADLNLSSGGGRDLPVQVVPEGMVFVMGDHRGGSRDSRVFGLIPASDIYGRAFRLYFRSGEGLVWRPL